MPLRRKGLTGGDRPRLRALDEKQLYSLAEIVQRLVDVVALAGDVELRAPCDVTITFTLQQGGELHSLHGAMVLLEERFCHSAIEEMSDTL